MKKIIAIAVVALGAVYSYVWHTQAEKLCNQLPIELEARAKKLDPQAMVQYDRVYSSGFPLMPSAHVENMRITLPNEEIPVTHLSFERWKVTPKLSQNGVRIENLGSYTVDDEDVIQMPFAVSVEFDKDREKSSLLNALPSHVGIHMDAADLDGFASWTSWDLSFGFQEQGGMHVLSFETDAKDLKIHENVNQLADELPMEAAEKLQFQHQIRLLTQGSPHSWFYRGHVSVASEWVENLPQLIATPETDYVVAGLFGLLQNFEIAVDVGEYSSALATQRFTKPFVFSRSTATGQDGFVIRGAWDGEIYEPYVKHVSAAYAEDLDQMALTLPEEQRAQFAPYKELWCRSFDKAIGKMMEITDGKIGSEVDMTVEVEMPSTVAVLNGAAPILQIAVKQLQCSTPSGALSIDGAFSVPMSIEGVMPSGAFTLHCDEYVQALVQLQHLWNDGLRELIGLAQGTELPEIGEREVQAMAETLDSVQKEPGASKLKLVIEVNLNQDRLLLGDTEVSELTDRFMQKLLS